MTTEVLSPTSPSKTETFQTGRVLTIVGGHFVHDSFSAFVPPLLPLLIEKLSLSLTAAGLLTVFIQLPSLFQPFIGYLADRVSVRYFIIFAPAVTAALMSVLGSAPNYTVLVVLLLLAGVSVAAFHAPAPAMIGRVSGRQIGKGMSFFMFGGEMGRFAGPLLITAAVSAWALEGTYPVMVFGLVASFVLYWRLKDVPARSDQAQLIALPHLWGTMKGVLLPLSSIVLARAFLLVTLSTYLPTFMTGEGATLWLANSSLAILELAGAVGALAGGTLSDRWGRAWVLMIALIASPLFVLIFLATSGWWLLPLLIFMGLTALSTTPVLMAIVQEQFPENRALANGTFLAMMFAIRSVVTLVVGAVGDLFGLRLAFVVSAIVALSSVPLLRYLPQPNTPPLPAGEEGPARKRG
ncbi:MAG: MFS transporter [Anaerolineae bacterium]